MRIGTDIGGTFTDIIVIDDASGDVIQSKLLTSSADPAHAVREALDDAGVDVNDASFFSHGTTIAINAVVERKGARTGIVTTVGMEDLLELRKGARTHIIDPLMEKPYCFVPGRLSMGVPERISWDGSIIEPLDEDAVVRAVQHLITQGVESIAVCLLNAYANPTHERRVRQCVEAKFPDISVTLSSELVGEIGEFERLSTAALNAYIRPTVAGYLAQLVPELRDCGFRGDVHIMQSSGGITTAEAAARQPIRILESGPAGGSMAAMYMASLIGIEDVITLDMGGTTTKASVIEGGEPLHTTEFALFEEPGKPGSGWPIRTPMIDIIEVGSGGGSIARVDPDGRLSVGPESAGSDPGPVCYDRGGDLATITDAHAVLGTVGDLLGGEFELNIEAARQAITEQVALPLALSVDEAAMGIVEIGVSKAADVIREVTIARGRDPRDFTLVAFGGAGPLVAASVMEQLGMRGAAIPPLAGNFSAFGLLCTDLVVDAAQTHIAAFGDVTPDDLRHSFGEIEERLTDTLRRQGLASDDIVLIRTVDVRYQGQFHLINLPLGQGVDVSATLDPLRAAFHAEHERLYTYTSGNQEIEFVNLRVRGIGTVPRPSPPRVGGAANADPESVRAVYFRGAEERRRCPVYRRDLLGAGTSLYGPGIVEELTSTTVIPSGFHAVVDEHGNLVMRVSND